MNLDLIQPLVEEWALCKVPLQHVRGHQSVGPEAHGNNWVDRAAVAAVGGTPMSIGALPMSTGVDRPVRVAADPGAPVKSILKKTIDIDTWSAEKAEKGPDLEFITHTPIKACPREDSFRPNDIRRWFS
jgi:hypothetical protein